MQPPQQPEAAAAANAAATMDAPNDDNDECLAEARTVFVGNLPPDTTNRKSLAHLFRDCGPIESTRLRCVAAAGVKVAPERAGDQRFVKKVCANLHAVVEDNGRPAQGYVVFRRASSVALALKKNNQLVVEEGTSFHLRVDRALPQDDSSRSVFVGNLPYKVQEEQVAMHFVKEMGIDRSKIQGVRIVRDTDTQQCKGFGYVLFVDKSLAADALRVHQTAFLDKKHKLLRVMVCGKRTKKKARAAAATNNSSNNNNKNKKRGREEESRAPQWMQDMQSKPKQKRIRGGDKDPKKKAGFTGGKSKRAVAESKRTKLAKKLEKRVTKGMGKNKR